MGKFDEKQFNELVFRRYMETIENPRVNRLIKAGIFVIDPKLQGVLPDGVGGNYMQENFVGRLAGTDVLYDGSTNITADTLDTYKRGLVVIGKARAFKEEDFTESITGKDFMSNVAEQLVEYQDEKHQDVMLLILKALFDKSNGVLKAKRVEKSLASLSATDIIDGLKVQGDKSGNIRAIAMHSAILAELKKANLVQNVKFIEVGGIQRDLGIYTLDGREVIEDDTVAPEESYAKTTDVAIVSGKVYYTKSGDVYTKVETPDVSDIGDYYERTLAYPVYLLGRNAFTWQPLGVKVPLEMWRQPLTNGGQTFLINRERYFMAPFGCSFKASGMAGLAPTDAELATASSWELCNTGGVSPKSIELKTIPLACIVFSITGI